MDQNVVMLKGLAQLNEAMSHAVQGHPRWTGCSERSDKTWSTAGRNGKPLQYSCCKNPINSIKRQKDMTLEDEPPGSEGVQYATEEEWRAITNSAGKNEAAETKQKRRSVVYVSGGESKVQCCKEQYCI